MTSHNGDRPHRCTHALDNGETCNKDFTRADHLKRHLYADHVDKSSWPVRAGARAARPHPRALPRRAQQQSARARARCAPRVPSPAPPY